MSTEFRPLKDLQTKRGLAVTGVVDEDNWSNLIEDSGTAGLSRQMSDIIARLAQPQRFRDSCTWRLTDTGIAIDAHQPVGTVGIPTTVQNIWKDFGPFIDAEAQSNSVPVELIVATIATESGGKANAERHEPGWVSNDATPQSVSIGLMQTLISTARDTMGNKALSASDLLQPATSIAAGTRYIASQFDTTGFDPPRVACAYNAGGIYYEPSNTNIWRMRQFPIGTPDHANHFIAFFNDFFSLLLGPDIQPKGPSFAAALKQPSH